jgi:simple sugar transport system permease protein
VVKQIPRGRDLAYVLGKSFEHQEGPQVGLYPVAGLSGVPLVGRIFFAQDPVVYASFFSIAAAWYLLYHTQAGLRLRGLGENPRACYARGVNVIGLRYLWIALGGALVGLGGAAFTLCIKGWSRPDVITGKGWIALAIVIFGGWHPVRAALGVYLFVALEHAAIRWQNALPSEIPSQLVTCLPFPMMVFALLLVTLVSAERTQRLLDRLPEGPRKALEGTLGLLKASPPAALGQEFKPDQ